MYDFSDNSERFLVQLTVGEFIGCEKNLRTCVDDKSQGEMSIPLLLLAQ